MTSKISKVGQVFTLNSLFVLLAAGGIAEILLEFFAWWGVPALLGIPMRPDKLVAALAMNVFDARISVVLAVSIHLALGFLIFPIAFAVGRAVIGFRRTLMPALIFGVILWATAQMILAPLAGRPFMLGLITYTWVSLVLHIVYTVVFALSIDKLSQRAR